MGSFKKIYQRPYKPLIVRDILSDCDIAQHEIAAAVGVNKETLRLAVNRGYIPGYKKDFRKKVEAFIFASAIAVSWLRNKKLKLADIWNETNNRQSHLYPAGHGRRLYRFRTPEGALPAPLGTHRDRSLKGFSLILKNQKEKEAKLMQSRLEILAEYGYSKDPFRNFYMETADSLRVKRLLKMAVESRAMVSIVASWGVGKTTSLDLAFRDIDALVVKLITPDKERVVVSDIEKALILGLSNESCKRTKEVRARQIRRIVGEASRGKPIVLVLEEAHRMHGQTLRALKTFREMEWMGQSPLFTVIMIGQYDPMRKRYVDEVRLRTDTVHMKGITGSEVKDYISSTVGKCFEPDAIEALSRMQQTRTFLDLHEMLIALMGRALETGNKKVTALEVYELYGGGIKEVMKRTGVKLIELEKATGIPKSTLSMVTNDQQNTMTDTKFKGARDAVAEVLRQKIGGTEEKRATLKVVEQ
jgi:type II secretory pathway predicted ATPase ExeA